MLKLIYSLIIPYVPLLIRKDAGVKETKISCNLSVIIIPIILNTTMIIIKWIPFQRVQRHYPIEELHHGRRLYRTVCKPLWL